MAKYGVYVEEVWEAWMTEHETLKEARAEVKKIREEDDSDRGVKVSLVRILSQHSKGDLHVG